jgi:hypothetical protein
MILLNLQKDERQNNVMDVASAKVKNRLQARNASPGRKK